MSAIDVLEMSEARQMVVAACALETLRFRARVRQEQADG